MIFFAVLILHFGIYIISLKWFLKKPSVYETNKVIIIFIIIIIIIIIIITIISIIDRKSIWFD